MKRKMSPRKRIKNKKSKFIVDPFGREGRGHTKGGLS